MSRPDERKAMEVSYGVVEGKQGLHPQNLRTDASGTVHAVSLYEIAVDYSDGTQGHLPVEYVRTCNVRRVDHARTTWTDEPPTCPRCLSKLASWADRTTKEESRDHG